MTKGGIAARCCFNKSLLPRDDFTSLPLTTGTPILATAHLDIGYSVLDIGYSVFFIDTPKHASLKQAFFCGFNLATAKPTSIFFLEFIDQSLHDLRAVDPL